ncbi:hypothetical protein AB1282_20275 [Gottfriedia sp. S16(2024)]|uniref:hypothetical protein n=1 Tax=Gottfriedia sp. S16(2024) TaxID=3162883 RepID=UPI003D1B5746
MKKRISIGILLVVLLVSGIDFTFKDAFIYALIYFVGKSTVYYFESKKINWKQNIKDFAIFIFFTFTYHICYLILVMVGFKPFKIFSNGIGFIGAILVGLTMIYITFNVPYKILKQKRK